MPSSGGSVSDAPVNKVVDGQSHYLAYITPDEGKSLTDQGGKEVVTDTGIPAYPGHHGVSGSSMGVDQGVSGGEPPGGGDPEMTYDSRPPQLGGSGTIEQAEQFQDTSGQKETKENLITKVKNKIISKTEALDIASKLGWVTDNAFVDALGGAFGVAMTLGDKAQSKAINWDLNRRLNKTFKEVEKGTHPGALGYKISDLQDKMERSQLDPSDPRHYGQSEYMDDYPGQDPAPDRDRDNDRGLINIITPYAAHAVGGTTQQPSMAAQWYANMGGSQGGFNLTTQYAAAKAIVAKRLGSTSAVGQLAVNQSSFYNFLKDNSLDKGIL